MIRTLHGLFSLQYLSNMENIPPGVESGPSDQFRFGSHGAEVNNRPDVQRLHIKFRIRRIHKVSPYINAITYPHDCLQFASRH